jgi:transcriptional regulator with XRE-family HTH domain
VFSETAFMSVEGFAGRLRELREGAGLSREQLAERAGIRSSRIRDLEQGLHSPRWETILALANALAVDCTAFTQPAVNVPPPRTGRPRKAAQASVLTEPAAGKKPAKKRKKKP